MNGPARARFAWSVDGSPGDIAFRHELPDGIGLALGRALSCCLPSASLAGAKFHALHIPQGIEGSYRLVATEGQWFIRVTSRAGNPGLEKQIVDYLLTSRVPVNALVVSGFPFEWEGELFYLQARPFIAGRHYHNSENDLTGLAKTLSLCHKALNDFPGSHDVREAAKARAERLAEVRDRLARALDRRKFDLFSEHAVWAEAHQKWLIEMVEQFVPHLETLPDAQCLHGEIHPGNVLFQDGDGKVVLIDFEESPHVYAPHAWDIAHLVLRFCLWDNPDKEEAIRRLHIVAKAYGQPLPALSATMRQASWFAVATILDIRDRLGVVTPREECEKFVRLEQQARKYSEIL